MSGALKCWGACKGSLGPANLESAACTPLRSANMPVGSSNPSEDPRAAGAPGASALPPSEEGHALSICEARRAAETAGSSSGFLAPGEGCRAPLDASLQLPVSLELFQSSVRKTGALGHDFGELQWNGSIDRKC